MNRKLTTEEIIEKSKRTHGDKYDYSLVNYIDAHTKIKIICPKHGIFEQRPGAHISGQGCPKCVGLGKDTKQFIEEAKAMFPQYDYSLVNYVDSKIPVKIICPKHGIFEQQPNRLLIGKGCMYCGRELQGKEHRISIEEIKNRYRKNHEEEYYDPVFSEENIISDKMLVCCNICGAIFSKKVSLFVNGIGCPVCNKKIISIKKSFSKEEFIKKSENIHGKFFIYDRVKYNGKSEKVEIGCPKCGNYFFQTPDAHWKGGGCPYCRGSAGEIRINEYLTSKNINFIPQKEFDDCKDKGNLSYDFYLKDYRLLIEFNGEQHYKWKAFDKTYQEFLIQKHHDWLKRKYATDNKYKLLIIPYWEYDKIDSILDQNLNL